MPQGKIRKISAEVINEITNLKTQGLTLSKIANEIDTKFGIKLSDNDVSKICIKNGMRTHSFKRFKRKAKAQETLTIKPVWPTRKEAIADTLKPLLADILKSNLEVTTKLELVRLTL